MLNAFDLKSHLMEFLSIDRADLKLLIGEKLYNQPGDGCWSCHGAEGIKADGVSDEITKKHQNIAALRNPATWTSFRIIKNPFNKMTCNSIGASKNISIITSQLLK